MSDSRIEKPFSEYKDFSDCVSQNQDKADPQAYCGEIKSRTEKSETKDCPCNSIRILKQDNGEFLIYGPASVPVVDREGDRIRADALQLALSQLLKRGRLSLGHEDILVGDILPEREVGGKLYKTEVKNNRLMVLGNIWDDSEDCQETRQRVEKGELKSYSISGKVRKGGSQRICDSSGCFRDIFKIDLSAVTVCEKGMNQLANFDVLQKSDGTIEYGYKTIATPQKSNDVIDIHASEKETEVNKIMAENTTPPQEAKKEAAPGAAPAQAGAGNGGVEGKMSAICDKMDAICEKMAAMMGGGGQVQAAQKAAEPAAPAPAAQPAVEKALTKADVELMLKEALAKMVSADPAATTPRPAIKKQDEFANSEVLEIMKDPSKLDKMSIADLKELGA